MRKIFILTLLLLFMPLKAFSLSFKPRLKDKPEVALIIVPGAQIKASQYEDLANTIQDASNLSLWIGIPEIPLDIANPITLQGQIQILIKQMRSEGFKSDRVILAGHSLGGAMAQELFKENQNLTHSYS